MFESGSPGVGSPALARHAKAVLLVGLASSAASSARWALMDTSTPGSSNGRPPSDVPTGAEPTESPECRQVEQAQGALPTPCGRQIAADLGIDQCGVKVISAYRVREIHLLLRFPEPNDILMQYRKRTTYEVLAPTRFVEMMNRWTGRGVQGPPLLTADQNLRPVQHGPVYFSDQSRSLLVDLGRELPVNTIFTLSCQIQFVDEAGTFERFNAYTSPEGLQRLTLSVSHAAQVRECHYSFRSDDAEVWDYQDESIEVSTVDGDVIHSVAVDNPPAGRHRLTWN